MSDPQEKLQADQEFPDVFSVMWFETTMGVRYQLPDMLQDQVSKAHKSLDHSEEDSMIIAVNVAGAILMVPKRIIGKAGVGERCFWEAT